MRISFGLMAEEVDQGEPRLGYAAMRRGNPTTVRYEASQRDVAQ